MSLAKSFIWMTLAEVLFNISGYVVHSGAGRILSPADYGRYGLIVTLSIIIIALIGNGIPISMSKYLSEAAEKNPELISVIKRKGFYLQAIIIALIMVIFFVFTPIISKFLKDDSLTPLFRISIFILPAYAIDTFYFYYLTGIHKFNFQSVLKLIRSILRMTIILGMIYLWKLEGAIFGYIAVPFIVFLIAWIYDKMKYSKNYPKYDNKISFDWKKLLNYAWPITLFMIFYEVLISLDIYFIKSILEDDYQTGIYNSALMIARIPYYLFYALSIIILPSISKSISQNNHEKARKLISQSLRLLFIILTPLSVLMAVYSNRIINFVFGVEYISATVSLQILVFGIGFLTIFYILSFALNGAGIVKTPMWIALGGMILNAILNYFFIHYWGITGSAVAMTITSFIVMAFSLIYTSKHFKNIFSFKDIFFISIGGIILFFVAKMIPFNNFTFIPLGIIFSLLFFTLIYWFKIINKSDLQFVIQEFRRKK